MSEPTMDSATKGPSLPCGPLAAALSSHLDANPRDLRWPWALAWDRVGLQGDGKPVASEHVASNR